MNPATGQAVEFAYVTVLGGEDAETPGGGVNDTFSVPTGTTLRDALVDHGVSPYTRVTERLNCGGRGLCATCGVRVRAADSNRPGSAGNEPLASDRNDAAVPPEHWHDRLADRFGYPRLSCQITVDRDLDVAIPEKLVWGRRE